MKCNLVETMTFFFIISKNLKKKLNSSRIISLRKLHSTLRIIELLMKFY